VRWTGVTLAALAIVAVGFVGFRFAENGRYQIVSVRAPYDFDAPPQLDKWDPNDPLLHETIMLDTATGRTWRLHMVQTDETVKSYTPWWIYLGYRSQREPDMKNGTRVPN
jgi:hypothetical protein